jgi:hypothetical protein
VDGRQCHAPGRDDAYVDRDTSEGFTFLEGRDPDGLPVIIAYPGPEQAPRHLIKSRVYQP